MDEYKSRLSAYLSDMVREELEKYNGGFTDEWNDQRKKNAEVLGYKLSGKSDIKENLVDFYNYMNQFYNGKDGVYPDKKGRVLKVQDINKAISVYLKKKPNNHFQGDTVDREAVRDVLIKMRKLEPDYSKKESVNEKRIKNSPLRRNITSTFKDLDKKFRKKLTSYDIDSVASYITSKNRYFPKELANVAAEYFYEYKRRKLKINQAIQATINYQRGYPYKSYRTGTELESIVNEELQNSQGEQTDFKKGDLVKDINPDCPHHGSEGKVTKVGKGTITFDVTNNGKNYQQGDELEKTVDQMVKLKESVNESGILYKAGVKKYGKEGMAKILSAAGKRKSHAEIGAIKDKYEKESLELDEAGMGILTTDQADVLQAIVMRNKNKSTKSILGVALKSGHFKGVDKKELLGYIDGARQFVKYMKSHPMESVKEERDYKAEYKKYGSSTKAKKYRAELNQYNRKKGTYGNGDGKDASHKGGKIVGFEKESTNRGRREKSRLKKEDIREFSGEQGIHVYLGGIVDAMRKAGLKPKTAKQMKHGFSKSRDKIGFFIEVEQRTFGKKEMYTLQVEIDRDGNLWYLSGHRDMKLGKWADTSKIVRMWKALNKARGFGQDAIFKKR